VFLFARVRVYACVCGRLSFVCLCVRCVCASGHVRSCALKRVHIRAFACICVCACVSVMRSCVCDHACMRLLLCARACGRQCVYSCCLRIYFCVCVCVSLHVCEFFKGVCVNVLVRVSRMRRFVYMCVRVCVFECECVGGCVCARDCVCDCVCLYLRVYVCAGA
jgi:hypothetical protein